MHTLTEGSHQGRTATGRAVGSCSSCGSGITTDGVTADTVGACPHCGAQVRLRFVYSEGSEVPCDGRCMGAVGPSCSCSCDGQNHGRSFLRVELVPVFEQEQARKAQERRRAAHTERQERKRLNVEERAAAGRAALLAEHPLLEALLGDEYAPAAATDFMTDMRRALMDGEMTPRQVEATCKAITEDRERAARRRQREQDRADALARGVRAPAGRHTVSGVIVSARQMVDTRFRYNGVTTVKIVVRAADGWSAWGTLPKSTYPTSFNSVEYGDFLTGLPGRLITFTATLTPAGDDPVFAFFKRPTGATLGDIGATEDLVAVEPH